MSATRLTMAPLRQLATELPYRYALPLLHLARARALSGASLSGYYGSPAPSADQRNGLGNAPWPTYVSSAEPPR